MKYSESNAIGDAGEHLLAARIIKYFGFPCRLINIDIGIDAEVEIIDDNFKSTSQIIRAQVKTTNGNKLSQYIDAEHIKYWNKFNCPVVVFLVQLIEEEIYWHCVTDIKNYKLSKSGYKITFSKDDILKPSNKEKFKEITINHLKISIQKFYEEAYSIADTDLTEYLSTDNYDLTTFESFILRARKVKQNLKEGNKLAVGNKDLQRVVDEYSKKLSRINEYIEEVKSKKKVIEEDMGADHFNYLELNDNE